MFKLTYEDGSDFNGKSIDGSWNKAPNGKLSKLEYQYTYSKRLLLQGYKEYNHLVEKIAVIGKKEPIISRIFIMGRGEAYTDIFIIDLRTRNVTKTQSPIGQEYNGQVINGWKEGLLNNPGWDNI